MCKKYLVFMCFGSSGYNHCRKWDGMSYEKQPNAIHFHYDTRLSILDGEPFALGHMTATLHGNKAEVFHLDENKWEELAEYPWESWLVTTCLFQTIFTLIPHLIFQYLLLCHSKSDRQCGRIWRLEWT